MSEPAGEKPILVRLVANWCDSRHLCELFNAMTSDGNYEWAFRDLAGTPRRMRITWDESPDFWAVCNAPPADVAGTLDRSRTVVFQMEPLMWTERMRGLWGEWAAPSPLPFLQVRDHRRYRNSCDWWVGLTRAELERGRPPEKTRGMAACVSRKYEDPGHRKRVDFLRFLEGEDLDLDVYGDPDHGFRRYRGPVPAHDKSSCLIPYRYYFDAENNAYPNFFTEKIVDCLLAETLCFYWGCPNLDSYFDPRAFVRLELSDFEADRALIHEAIEADEWSRRLPFIRAEKRRILSDYGFFPTLAKVLDPVRRSRSWHLGPADREIVKRWIGERRGGTFVELSDRSGSPEESETLDVERRLDWTGICLESSASRDARVESGRSVRDCIVTPDAGEEPVAEILARNAIAADAVDWLNLAVANPSELLADGGRLDPGRVRANLITIPLADESERRLCGKRLRGAGYSPAPDAGGAAFRRDGAEDVFGFFHLCTIGTWREVIAEQLDRLIRSGLAERTRRIFVSVLGPEAAAGAGILRDALGERLEIVLQDIDPAPAERPILEWARRFCEEGEPLAAAVWYAHGKGVSPCHEGNSNVAEWRHLMEHFSFDRWPDSLAALAGHDACGVNWHRSPRPHFSGNFWWATPRYVRLLPRSIGAAPFDPEAWIGMSEPSVSCLHESGVDHYREPYPRERYSA